MPSTAVSPRPSATARDRRRWAAPGALASILLALPVHAGSPLCAGREETLYDCRSRGKHIAICASPGWSATSGYVQYRFGAAGHPEIVVPQAGAAVPPAQSVAVARGALSGGGFAYASFANGPTVYNVYSAVSGRHGAWGGVAVDRGDERVGIRACDRGQDIDFRGRLLDEPGLPAASTEFDLPAASPRGR